MPPNSITGDNDPYKLLCHTEDIKYPYPKHLLVFLVVDFAARRELAVFVYPDDGVLGSASVDPYQIITRLDQCTTVTCGHLTTALV